MHMYMNEDAHFVILFIYYLQMQLCGKKLTLCIHFINRTLEILGKKRDQEHTRTQRMDVCVTK